MMSRSLPSVKPAMAAAQPEYELSIDTTTGMSPPPMAMTRCHPSTSDTTVMMASGTMPARRPTVMVNQTMHTMMTISMTRLIALRPGSVSGLPEIFPESLRNATIEPVSVTAPMKTARPISPMWKAFSVMRVKPEYCSTPGWMRYELKPTSTAAAPTNEWSMATSCGISVIWTRFAFQMPYAPPMTSASTMSTMVKPMAVVSCSTATMMTAASASVMPMTPRRLPCRAVF